MRLRDFLTEHAIPWPPITFAPLSAGSKVLEQNDLRLASLVDVEWSEDDGDATIDLRLDLDGLQLPTAMRVPAGRLDEYRHLYEALDHNVGLTVEAIEDLEM